GTVYVGGEEWSARSDEMIAAGSSVKVINREGLVLIVEPVK
ncbi:MAG: NfeD family protein, partial [Anaerolineaceae bacterium]|nr:NfeD family protein [Anaerolineaceae bacterium]